MSKHVVIIGGGIIGLCSAWYCRQRGYQVTVIDRNGPLRDGCSYGNAGMIVPSHFIPLAAPGMVSLGLRWMLNPESPLYIRPRLSWDLLSWGLQFARSCKQSHVERSAPILRDLSFASRASYEELADQFQDAFGLVRNGLLMLCKTQHALDDEAKVASQANSLGVPAEVLDAQQAAIRDPAVTMNIAGAVLFPRDCHLSPDRLMVAMQRRLETDGCRMLWNSEVGKIDHRGGVVYSVQAGSELIPCDEVVLASGSWSSGLASQLGLKLPMQAGKGYSLTLEQPRQLPGLCSIFTEARVAITPMNGRLRFGGTMEFSGLNERIDLRRVRGIVKAIPNYFPEFQMTDFDHVKPWQGLRPCSPDGMPFLGRSRHFKNLVVATGHAMMGLSLGPVSGKIVAELIDNQSPTIDLTMLSPDRF